MKIITSRVLLSVIFFNVACVELNSMNYVQILVNTPKLLQQKVDNHVADNHVVDNSIEKNIVPEVLHTVMQKPRYNKVVCTLVVASDSINNSNHTECADIISEK